MSRPRDSYKARVFEASKAVPARVLTMEQWCILNDKVRDSAWGKKHIIKNGNIYRYAPCAGANRDPQARATDMMFCHALAHYMTPDNVAMHGPEYCRNLLEAVRKWISQEQADLLRKQMVVHKVKLRSWSPEARERAKQRWAERSFGGAAEELKAMLAELEAED